MNILDTTVGCKLNSYIYSVAPPACRACITNREGNTGGHTYDSHRMDIAN